MSEPKPLLERILPELQRSLKRIIDTEKITEDDQIEAYRKLILKVENVLERETKGERVIFFNEFSESVFSAWDDAFVEQFNIFVSKVDKLNWAFVDTTDERKRIREIDEEYNICGLYGTLYEEGKYHESLERLMDLVKTVQKEDQSWDDGFIGKIQKNAMLMGGTCITAWLGIIGLTDFSLMEKIIAIFLSPALIYGVVLIFTLLPTLLGNVTTKIKITPLDTKNVDKDKINVSETPKYYNPTTQEIIKLILSKVNYKHSIKEIISHYNNQDYVVNKNDKDSFNIYLSVRGRSSTIRENIAKGENGNWKEIKNAGTIEYLFVRNS
jgi:hypothetical protein